MTANFVISESPWPTTREQRSFLEAKERTSTQNHSHKIELLLNVILKLDITISNRSSKFPQNIKHMARNVIARSISFDPQVFAKMESRRGRLLMQRSEYITRCILADMRSGANTMEIHEDGVDLIPPADEKKPSKKKKD